MIVDTIENAHLYNNISENLAKALKVLKELRPADLNDGRQDIDGDNAYRGAIIVTACEVFRQSAGG